MSKVLKRDARDSGYSVGGNIEVCDVAAHGIMIKQSGLKQFQRQALANGEDVSLGPEERLQIVMGIRIGAHNDLVLVIC